MNLWVFGVMLAVMMAPSRVWGQAPCPTGRSFRLISTMNAVVGKSPLWVTTGGTPAVWEGSNHPIQALWIRDVSVRGPAVLGGKLLGGKAPAKFARVALGIPEERFKFDLLGEQPSSVKPADLEKYSFHRTFIWLPEPGCYEMTARVGPQQAVLYLDVERPAAKN